MNIILLFEEVPKNVATLLYIAVGALSSVVVYMYITHRTELKERDKYNRDQEKETLKILSELTNVLKDTQVNHNDLKTGVDNIKETASDSNKVINNLAEIIQRKLLNMN